MSFIFLITFKVPLPKYLDLSLSLNSRASCFPALAPLGVIDLKTPFDVFISTSTVGSPLESNISLAFIFKISDI